MKTTVQLEVPRGHLRMLRIVTVDVDGFGEHVILSVSPFDDLKPQERQQAIKRAVEKGGAR